MKRCALAVTVVLLTVVGCGARVSIGALDDEPAVEAGAPDARAEEACSDATPGACDAGDAGDAATCKRPSPKGGACATIYDPVCGCDGKTYGNDCSAELLVYSWTPGACEASDAGACKLAIPKNGACPAVVDEVCGCDGKTYNNACVAGHAITSWKPGPC